MPKAALIVIGIVYGISLAIAYIAHHPPTWAAEISVTVERDRTFRVLGHEITLRLDVNRAAPDGSAECPVPIGPPILRVDRSWDGGDHAKEWPGPGGCR
jgi:hypothetical protein